MFWLGIEEGKSELEKLSNIINGIMTGFNITPDNKKFKPHLTIGRVKRNCNKLENIDKFLDFKYEPTNNDVGELIFFESILTPHGANHRPIKIFKF